MVDLPANWAREETERLKKARVDKATQACARGEQAACFNLAKMHEAGGDAPRDPERAKTLFKQACAADHMPACVKVAGSLVYSKKDGERARGVELYEKACDTGTLEACYGLGRLYEEGRGGLARDEGRALDLYEKACVPSSKAPRSRDACRARGEIVVRRKLDTACQGGDPVACTRLGRRLNYGSAHDEARAFRLFESACKAKVGEACYELGLAMKHGQLGQKKDEERSRTLMKQACDLGYKSACPSP
jgi:TPR repeat protein